MPFFENSREAPDLNIAASCLDGLDNVDPKATKATAEGSSWYAPLTTITLRV